KYDYKHPKQIAGLEALSDFDADDLIPLSVVESVQFRKLVSILDQQYQPPSRKHVSTVLLTKKYDSLKKILRDKYEKASSVNLNIDVWSSRHMKSYIGITAYEVESGSASNEEKEESGNDTDCIDESF
uniref:HAT C-terminal dimerisation domain-containing protein n=1 Tax=Amphimedon queenslandica TaxID=400682 RepID=A0A1X7TUA3_AMPQE